MATVARNMVEQEYCFLEKLKIEKRNKRKKHSCKNGLSATADVCVFYLRPAQRLLTMKTLLQLLHPLLHLPFIHLKIQLLQLHHHPTIVDSHLPSPLHSSLEQKDLSVVISLVT